MKEKRGFLSSFLHIGIGTILNMLIGFITTPIITRLVLPAEYGRLSIFNLYISIVVMILCLGLDQSLVRYYYSHEDNQYKTWIIRKCSLIPIILSFVIPLILYLLIGLTKYDFEFNDTIIALILGAFGHMIFRFSILVLRLDGESKLYAQVNVINKIAYTFFAIGLIFITEKNNFATLAYSTVIAITLASIIAIYKMRHIWFSKIHNNDFNIKFKDLFKYGYPFILAMGLTTLFEAIDKISLNYYCDYSTVGVYAGAMNIVAVFAIVQSTFNTIWAPVSVEHYENNPDDTNFYSKCNLLITVIMFFFGFSLILCKDLFGLLLGKTYREAASIIPFLTLHPIMYTISETTVTGIVVTKKSYLHIVIAGISCLVNFVGNTMLVPVLGGKGAAISTGISYIVFYVLRTYFGLKYYKFENKPDKYFVLTLMLIINAAYNTFFEFGVVSVVLYIISIAIMLILYKDVALNIYTFIMNIIKNSNKQ